MKYLFAGFIGLLITIGGVIGDVLLIRYLASLVPQSSWATLIRIAIGIVTVMISLVVWWWIVIIFVFGIMLMVQTER